MLAAVFVVELAPAAVRRTIDPVIQLLAAVPSVIYGLIGILVVAPWIQGFISQQRKHSVQYVVQLTGANLTTAVVILALMIVPIMVAIIVAALETVPRSWTEGSAALGVNRWRTMWRVSLRTVRPAILAATVLATGRALGEAIMLSMVAGSRAYAVNPLDGVTFLFEPVRPLAATIIAYIDGISVVPLEQTLYAMAAVLLVSCAFLSLAAWAVKQPMKKYGIERDEQRKRLPSPRLATARAPRRGAAARAPAQLGGQLAADRSRRVHALLGGRDRPVRGGGGDRGADAGEGHRVRASEPAVHLPRGRRDAGHLGRVPRPDRGHAAARRARHR